MKILEIHTAKGILKAQLFEDEAPLTVAYFMNLVNAQYYHGQTFYKVIPDTLVQTGSPFNNGEGWTEEFIRDELHHPRSNHERGVFALANCGSNSNSSQFYIVLDETICRKLDGGHTCFAKLIDESWPILRSIEKGDVIDDILIKELNHYNPYTFEEESDAGF